MKLLIDAHALIWYVDQDHLLSPPARAAIATCSIDSWWLKPSSKTCRWLALILSSIRIESTGYGRHCHQ